MTRFKMVLGSLLTLLILSFTAASAQDYRVQPGDILRIEVIEDTSLNRNVLVSPDGRISLPGAGAIRASGRTIEQIQSALTAGLAGNFAVTPNVFVAVEQLAPEDPVEPVEDPVTAIFVSGEANNVGRIELEPGTTLLQAFAQFGGFTNFAATKRIQLHRGSTIYTVNYDAILDGSSPNGAVALREGDVIVVPQRRLFE
jgi:polysaccharide export outer membrane protein